VTGHTGFKGSWLSIWLDQLGAKVSGYALPAPSNPSNYAVSGVRKLLKHEYQADVRDCAALEQAVHQTNPEVILHLAAQPIVRESYTTPRETMDVNVMGTCNLLDCVRRRAKPCVVVVVTSDKCYENREHVWGYREEDAMGGHDPYSASKGMAELLTASYRRSFFPAKDCAKHGVKIASVRAGNVIGGGDWAADRIVPDIVRHLAARKPVPLRNPKSVRPWQHVLEPLSGYLTVACRMLASDDPALCDGWNFGPMVDGNLSVRELVDAFVNVWGHGSWQDQSTPNQPHEANLLRLSIDKAVAKLDWHPAWHVSETVSRTAEWYRLYTENPKADMHAACLEDIQAYCTSATTRVAPQPQARVSKAA
jgi:CDP-glucose 4,6-dehydratase